MLTLIVRSSGDNSYCDNKLYCYSILVFLRMLNLKFINFFGSLLTFKTSGMTGHAKPLDKHALGISPAKPFFSQVEQN